MSTTADAWAGVACGTTLAGMLRVVDVERPGLQTSVQDERGRLGLWEVGVPPSGAMDARSLARANALVGNDADAAGLEITLDGPTLRFPGGAVVAVCGAAVALHVDDSAVPFDAVVRVPAGAALTVGGVTGAGVRAYLAVRGGIDVAPELGSRATFLAGAIGGHEGRVLAAGDRLPVGAAGGGSPATRAGSAPADVSTAASADDAPLTARPRADLADPPAITHDWTLRVQHGPHGAPDLLTAAGLERLLAGPWEVHGHADRTGIRLSGPVAEFARRDGGDAGLHPSNVIETPYALGAIMLSGDTPIIVGPDGPSLGGFCAPLCVVRDDRWKLGQLRPGDDVTLELDVASRRAAHEDTDAGPLGGPPTAGDVAAQSARPAPPAEAAPAVLAELPGRDGQPTMRFRRAGDENVVVEYGDPSIDFALRLRVHGLQQAIREAALPGVRDLTPGVRCLQVRFDPDRIALPRLMDELQRLEHELPATDALEVPAREVTMPLSWEDPEAVKAMRHYQEHVFPDAPWAPDNIEYIRRINGLPDKQAVQDLILDTRYVVVGLGDVYLGAPVALPLDPRHQLVTTKYTPARTWTPENAVGIGGAFLCVYGMEGPGGYQLFGRTVPVWMRRDEEGRSPEKPWLLRHFDVLRFELVSADELLRLRARAKDGHHVVSIRERTFTLADRRALESTDVDAIDAHRARRSAAFEAERASWAA
ncbi:5-oxoprolinase/urea amidolyase family protein [Patulibacter minatonensis]|uniref:5-oxoprolinase/urea amidolyase family protein n=1 Tax=Patulibacter minatonensis TaxID=298163 RepID=UPI0004B398FF|nr:5-oxoprolinase/urea amidolyase family protein [Patulibacter minatonensis]